MACCNMRMTLCVCVFEWMWVKTILIPIDPQIIKMHNFTHEDHMVHGAHFDACLGCAVVTFDPHSTWHTVIRPGLLYILQSLRSLGPDFWDISQPRRNRKTQLRLVDVPADINRDASGSKLCLSISTVMWSLAHRLKSPPWFCQHDGARQRQRQEHQRGKNYPAREVARWHF